MREIATATIRLVCMPLSIKAMTIPSCDGWYNIYVNDRLTYEECVEALDHEYDHIMNGDFDKDIPGSQLK